MSEIFCTNIKCKERDCIFHGRDARPDDPCKWVDMNKDCIYKILKRMTEETGGKNDNDK